MAPRAIESYAIGLHRRQLDPGVSTSRIDRAFSQEPGRSGGWIHPADPGSRHLCGRSQSRRYPRGGCDQWQRGSCRARRKCSYDDSATRRGSYFGPLRGALAATTLTVMGDRSGLHGKNLLQTTRSTGLPRASGNA